jgi:hypothetical protein
MVITFGLRVRSQATRRRSRYRGDRVAWRCRARRALDRWMDANPPCNEWVAVVLEAQPLPVRSAPGRSRAENCCHLRRVLRTELIELFVLIVAFGAWGMSLTHPQHLGFINPPSSVIALFEAEARHGVPWTPRGPWEKFTDVLEDPPPRE